MKTLPFGLYDAFTDNAFGGSQAAIVSDAAWIDSDTRQKIACELGFPATCFINDYSNNSITVRFNQPKRNIPCAGMVLFV